MKTYKKVLLITSGCLILAGGVMMTAGIALGGRTGFIITSEGIQADEKEGTFIEKQETDLKNITSIDLENWAGDIRFEEGSELKIEYGYWDNSTEPIFEVNNGKLTMKLKGKKVYRAEIGFGGIYAGGWYGSNNGKNEYIKVYLPSGLKLEEIKIDAEYENLDMNTGNTEKLTVSGSYGNINLENVDAAEVLLDAEYCDVKASACKFGKFTLEGDYGSARIVESQLGEAQISSEHAELTLNTVEASDLTVKADYGTLKFKNVSGIGETASLGLLDAAFNYGEMDMANVAAKNIKLQMENAELDGDGIEAETGGIQGDYADIELKKLLCDEFQIKDNYGEVYLGLMGSEDDYDYLLESSYGTIDLNGSRHEGTLERERNSGKKIQIKGDNTEITVRTE